MELLTTLSCSKKGNWSSTFSTAFNPVILEMMSHLFENVSACSGLALFVALCRVSGHHFRSGVHSHH